MTTAASISTRDGLAEMLAVLNRLEPDRTALGAPDRLECVRLSRQLADRTAALAAVLVAEADAAGASEKVAGAAMSSWLTIETAATKREAAGVLKQGRALAAHPAVAGAALGGDIGGGQARSITKVLETLTPQLDEAQQREAEQVLVGMARGLDADGLAQAAPQVLAKVAPRAADELLERKLQREAEQARRERSLRFYEVGGSIRFDGSLPKPIGLAWKGLIDGYAHAVRRTMLEERERLAEPVTWEQRQADALALLIQQHQRRLGSSMAGTAGRQRTAAVSERSGVLSEAGLSGTPDQAGWWGPTEEHAGPVGSNRPVSGAGSLGGRSALADRARIFVILDYDTLREQAAGAGLLNGVEPLSAGDLRRLCCDAGILPVVMSGESVILDLGQERRLVSPELRTALELRDRGCVMPGCDVGPVGCEAHHVVPWASGGPTALHNLVLLCVQHHPRFEPAKHGLRQPWRVQIGSDGVPEVVPPPLARLGDAPIRHQRFRSPPARAG